MKYLIRRPELWAAGALAIASAAYSAPSHAFLSSMFGKCQDNAGSLRIVEPDDGLGAWATYGLPAPTRMLRVLVNDSKCFTVLDRGVGFAAAQAERDLAFGGHLQEGQNIGAGQMRGADFVLIPDIVSQNPNAGGMNIGGSASSGGSKRGLMGGMLNIATLGISGKLSTQKQTAEVVLTLVNVRTSEQLISVSGEAKITDKAWAAAVAASNVQGAARVNVGSWENTEIGKVIKEAYEEAFSRMVTQINRRKDEIQGQPASLMAATQQAALQHVAPVQAALQQAAPVQVALQQVAPVQAALQQVAPMQAALQQAAPVQSALQEIAPSLVAPVVQAALVAAAPMVASGVETAVAAAEPGAAVQQLASGGTLVLRRMARLLSGASNQAGVVAELKAGMLLFPTGSAEGSMLNVEDEMGNKGWVPAAAVETAQ